MRTQPPEHHRPDYQRSSSDYPKYTGHPPVFPEPHLVYETLPVPLDDVEDRVELQQEMVGRRKNLHVPEDWCQVETHLKKDGNEGTQVSEKDHHRRGDPGNSNQQNNGAKQIVWNLNHINIKTETVRNKHNEYEQDEKKVNDQGRENLDNGKDADTESDLLNYEGVLHDGTGAVVDTVTEEEPGEYAADQPEDIGIICYRLGLKPDLKDKPEYSCHGQGKQKGPHYAEVGAQVTGFKVTFGQLDDDVPAREEFGNKNEKHPDALHVWKPRERKKLNSD